MLLARLLFAIAVLNVAVPETVKLSDTVTVPPEESRVRPPDDVDTVLPFTVTLSAAMSPVTVRVPTTLVVSKSVVPSTSKFPLASILPAITKLDAMSTAPSMSTTSKFVVPSTSKSPLKSAFPVRVRLPIIPAFSSTSNVSICAVPSMNKSFHSFEEDPKSYDPSSSGMILLSTSPPNTILSVFASPSVRVPPLKVVVPVTVTFPPTSRLANMCTLFKKVDTPTWEDKPAMTC